MKSSRVSLLTFLALSAISFAPFVEAAQPEAVIPAFTITDQNGTVVGAYEDSGALRNAGVILQNSANGENFFLLVGPEYVQGSDSTDVWYTNADCTGTPYVESPSFQKGSLAHLRGSLYAIGKNPAAANPDCVIVRGVGVGAINDGAINSRYRTNKATGPVCQDVDPGVNTVVATVVDNVTFCSLVRPFKID